MKHYRDEYIPGRHRSICYKRTCDMCSKESADLDDWTQDKVYHLEETTIKLKRGDFYPEGGSGTLLEIDICPDCFLTKLIPWLQSQGVEAKEKELEY